MEAKAEIWTTLIVILQEASGREDGDRGQEPAPRRYQCIQSTKHTLANLRHTYEKLHQELEELKHKRRAIALVKPSAPQESESILRVRALSAWRGVAMRQLKKRKESEAENRRLKRTISKHKLICEEMARLLARATTTPQVSYHEVSLVELTQDELCAELMAIVDYAYKSVEERRAIEGLRRDTDAVECRRVSEGSCALSRLLMSSEWKNSCINVEYTRTVPFALSTCSDLVWEHFRGSDQPKHSSEDGAEETTFRRGFHCSLNGPQASGILDATLVGRRYVKHGCSTIIWAMELTARSQAGSLPASSWRVYGWNVVAPVFATQTQEQLTRQIDRLVVLTRSDTWGTLCERTRSSLKALIVQSATQHQETIQRLIDGAVANAPLQVRPAFASNVCL